MQDTAFLKTLGITDLQAFAKSRKKIEAASGAVAGGLFAGGLLGMELAGGKDAANIQNSCIFAMLFSPLIKSLLAKGLRRGNGGSKLDAAFTKAMREAKTGAGKRPGAAALLASEAVVAAPASSVVPAVVKDTKPSLMAVLAARKAEEATKDSQASAA